MVPEAPLPIDEIGVIHPRRWPGLHIMSIHIQNQHTDRVMQNLPVKGKAWKTSQKITIISE